jgi:gamma-glutamyltranspeptidase/glutathione hydrolase
MRLLSRCCAAFLLFALAASLCAQEQPRRGRGRRARQQAQPVAAAVDPPQLEAVEEMSDLGMVVSGSADASEAGARVLAAGGNAIDAAVATAFAIGVVEPGQSGLGGQSYMLVYLADGRSFALDGSALAPLRVKREELARLDEIGQRYGSQLAATPGSLAVLSYALGRFGTRQLHDVIRPAIALAEFGSVMGGYQRTSLEHYIDRVRESTYASALYLKDGYDLQPPEHRFCNSDLSRTLWRIATAGAGDFYRGKIAREIVADMKRHGGFIGADDLGSYRPIEREPLRGAYRGHEVLSFPPPCAGSSVIETLQILENFSPDLLRTESADRLHVIIEAGRLAAYDESFVDNLERSSARHMLDRSRAAQRAAQIRLDGILTLDDMANTDDGTWRDRDTTHISVADRYGNAVALTSTLGRGFGSCTATPGLGFPFNAILESFDAVFSNGRHALVPLRPLFTSIAPTIVLRQGRPFLVLGSAGSGRIVQIVVSLVLGVVDGRLTIGEAQSYPRAMWSGGRRGAIELEMAEPFDEEVVSALQASGFSRIRRLGFPAPAWDLANLGGANAILVTPDGTLIGACDPRRGGRAAAVCPGDASSDASVPGMELWDELFSGWGARGGARSH